MIKSEFRKNIVTLMSGTAIAQAIPLAISPILTRIYTPEDFGVLALFLALAGVFSSGVLGRYDQALMLPKSDIEAVNIFALAFLLNVSFSLFLLFIISIFHEKILFFLANDAISSWLYFIPLTVFLLGSFNLLSAYNNRYKAYKDIAQATLIKSIVLSSLQLLLGFLKGGAFGLISGQIFSQLFANMQLLRNIFKQKELFSTISKESLKNVATKYSNFPKFQAPHAMLNTFSSNIPIYIFSSFFTTATVGFYTLSIRIVLTPLMILSTSTSKVYNQKVTNLYNEGADIYTFTVKILLSFLKKIILPFWLFIFFAPELFALLFGEAWREAGYYTQLLSPWLFIVFFSGIISFLPGLLQMQKKALFIEIVYTLLRLIAIFYGVYHHSMITALVAFSLVGFLMVSYNTFWILSSLKKVS